MVATSSSAASEDTVSTLTTLTESGGKAMERLVNTFRRNASSFAGISKSNVDVSVQTQRYKIAVDGFAESTKVALCNARLIQCSGPVIAFKLVVTLDLKRRENEVKVQAMKVEMESMMAVFLQLQDHPDPSGFHADFGLQNLMKEIEEEITDAFSFCDYYMNKSLMRRCLKSSIYEIRFADYAQRFYDLGVRLHRQLSLHVIWGIYSLKESSEELSTKLDEVKDQLRDLFALLETDREKELLSFIESSGGARACVENDTSLRELMVRSGEGASGGSERGGRQLQLKKTLREELSEDIDKALQQNHAIFQGKLDLQLREINFNISREGNRIITALSGGHERIVDKHIREIWRDMGWKSTVKARHFVFALRDYYHGGLHNRRPGELTPISALSSGLPSPPLSTESLVIDSAIETTTTIDSDDGWALDYIKVSFLQPIAEAIDDDGSSFITTREINDFITMRPEGCSILQWIAYWAAGWHSSVSQYVDKIYRLLRKFHRLREKILFENLDMYDSYLHHVVFSRLHHLLRSTNKATSSIHPQLATFRDKFTRSEEDRLIENLEKLSFNIDSSGTAKLVTGPYRIERYIYPLIYVLLKHHLKVIQLGRSHILNVAEFDNKVSSLYFIFEAFGVRIRELAAVFKQMNLVPKSHLEHYAFGMFHGSYGTGLGREADETTRKAWASLPVETGEEEDVETCPQGIPLDILQYTPEKDPREFDASSIVTDLVNVDCDSSSIHGFWSAILYDEDEDPFQGIFRIALKPLESGRTEASGSGTTWFGSHEVRYAVESTHTHTQNVDILILLSDDSWLRCIGTFDPLAATIAGEWHSSTSRDEAPPQNIGAGSSSLGPPQDLDQRSIGVFRFSRTPASFMRFRPKLEEMKESPTKARWNFFRESILFAVRRDNLVKDHVTMVLRDGRKFVELQLKWLIWQSTQRQLDKLREDEDWELTDMENRLSPSAASFLYNIALFLLERLHNHHGITCDGASCAGSRRYIIQTRYFCIACWDSDSGSLDFCVDCKDTTSTKRFPSHITSHSLIRVHRDLHDCDQFETLRKAREISQRIKAKFDVQDFPVCAICTEQLRLPCWVCIVCVPDRLVCTKYDLKDQTIPSRHKMTLLSISQFKKMHGFHPMVWIRDDKEVNIPEKDQLTRLEDHVNLVSAMIETRLAKDTQPDIGARLGTVEERLSALEKRFDSLETLIRSCMNPRTDEELD